MRRAAALILLAASCATAGERSAAVRNEFKRHHPCPATGERHGACPGWVIDHVTPLCAGGPDHVSNLQWQTREDALRKDADERRLCRSLKRV
jgi:hypothetical protein